MSPLTTRRSGVLPSTTKTLSRDKISVKMAASVTQRIGLVSQVNLAKPISGKWNSLTAKSAEWTGTKKSPWIHQLNSVLHFKPSNLLLLLISKAVAGGLLSKGKETKLLQDLQPTWASLTMKLAT